MNTITKAHKIEDKLEQIETQLSSISELISKDNAIAYSRLVKKPNDELDIYALCGVLWKGKWIVTIFTFLLGILSLIYAISLPNIYKSETLLAPVSENSSGGLAGIAGQLGGLASLAGVNLGDGSGDKTVLAIEVLKSRDFLTKFIENNELLIPLMAAKGWNIENNELILDADIYDLGKSSWTRDAKPPRSAKPTLLEARERLLEIMSLQQNKKSNYLSISVSFFSPYYAKKWVEMLTDEINNTIRKREQNEAMKNLEYLTAELSKTSVSEMQTVFYQLIEEQTKKIMISAVRKEYVFTVIDSATVPEIKAGPDRKMILAAGLFLGGIVGVLVVLFVYFLKAYVLRHEQLED